MKGVQYFFDEDGEPKAVLIDLTKNAELWEDIVDILEARKRANEIPIPFEKVREDMRKKRKVS
jgi:hypothetical protein